jgi:F-type H+-transporting ATPase subunit delta
MNEGLVTKRYVKALYQLADEGKTLEKVVADVEVLLACIQESPEFSSFLENPLIKPAEKNKVIQKLFTKTFQTLTLSFLDLLIRNRREMHLKSMCLHFMQYYKSFFRIKEGVITTAMKLSPKYKDEIYNFITKKFKMKIEFSEKIDPAIIGGFILRVEDQQIDASIQTQLRKIRRELIRSIENT